MTQRKPTKATTDFVRFTQTYPDYQATTAVDTLRADDFPQLHGAGAYLDFTGGGLFGQSQLQAHARLLQTQVLGNPHSEHIASRRSTDLLQAARASVLNFFDAPEDDYVAIFTANATGALRLVGESYPFGPHASYLLLVDNHNSVNGIREYAKAKGAAVGLARCQPGDLRIDHDDVLTKLDTMPPGLFAYPAQSNFSGVQHSGAYIEAARQRGWDVLLDAAAFAPTNPLSIRTWQADFVAISFYKMFGWPTGVGCLIARKKALSRLNRPWFSGGTVWAVSAQGNWHAMLPDEAAFEDGTVNYLTIPAIPIGLDYLRQIGMETIHSRVTSLTGWLLRQLTVMKHANGAPLAEVYGPTTTDSRGPTVTFNFLAPNGQIVDERIVMRAANKAHIALRTGCFCNPGASEIALEVRESRLRTKGIHTVMQHMPFDDFLGYLGLQSAGAIRLSLGFISNFTDIERFLQFAQTFRNLAPQASGLPPRTHC